MMHGNKPYLSQIDYNERILEIGPLNRPMVPKDKGPRVFYADVWDTQDIKQNYRQDAMLKDQEVCPLDFRIEGSYKETLADKGVEPFRYVLASHVIEHIPLLLHFFSDIASVMEDDGQLCLTIPDHRYCFDHFRMPTSFSEAYDVHVNGITRLAHRVMEYQMMKTGNAPQVYWKFEETSELLPDTPFAEARKAYEEFAAGKYVDVHFSVFTPVSFLLLLYNMHRAAMNPFRFIGMTSTTPNSFEFHVVLRKDPRLPSSPKAIAKEMIKLKWALSDLQKTESKTRNTINK